MVKYTLKRILLMIITLFLITTLLFFLLKLMPGSPFANPKITPAQREFLESTYGLNDHPVVQYFRYMKNLVQGDLGRSIKFNVPVIDMIAVPLQYTVQIGLSAMGIGTVIGIIFGATAALRKNTPVDHGLTFLSVIGVSIPNFVVATFFVLLSVRVNWISTTFQPQNDALGVTAWMEIKSMILPVTSLSIYVVSSIMRYTRSEMVEVLSSDYILLARAKGVKRGKVIFKHALRNALIPVITVAGPMTAFIITGSTVVERFFGVPGISGTMITAISTNDYFLILGIALFYSVLLIGVILIVDLLYGVIDPRIRVSGGNSHE